MRIRTSSGAKDPNWVRVAESEEIAEVVEASLGWHLVQVACGPGGKGDVEVLRPTEEEFYARAERLSFVA